MGRELKRVALDFAHPQDEIWSGYLCEFPKGTARGDRDGAHCTKHAKHEWVSADGECRETCCTMIEPPAGDGYQLWETTSEGSPCSPVFATLDELCAYAADNCSTFADSKATEEEWRKMLGDGMVTHEETYANGTKVVFI